MVEKAGNASLAMAMQQPYTPWSVPETHTIYNYAPEEIRSFLHPHWHDKIAPHPLFYYFFGILYSIVGVMAIGGNWMVLRIFGHNPALRSPSNMLVMNLAATDLLLMITMVPECVYNFYCGGPWQFGNIGCQFHAFCGAICGYSQINTLVFISYDRYNVIVNGFKGDPLTFTKAVTWITLIWFWAFGWSIAPIFGWGAYAMDGMLGTCSFDGLTTTMNNKTHILAAFICLFCIPVFIILACYYFIVRAVFQHEDELRQQAKKMNVTSLRSNSEQQAVSAEIRIAKVAIINVSLWIIAWSPFAIVCMVGTWSDTSRITPLVNELPVILSKTSCVYNPIIYGLSHPKYREGLKELYPWLCITTDEGRKKKKNGADNQSISSSKTEATENTLS